MSNHQPLSDIPEYLREPFGEDTFPVEPAAGKTRKVWKVETQLSDAPGIFGYYSASKRFGTSATIKALQEAGRIWAARHPEPRIGVGDISLKGGGDIAGHGSHETGRDVDLRPVRNDGTEGRVTWLHSRYSHSLTQELIDILYSTGVVQIKVIGFNDPQCIGTVNWNNHDNHLHARFYFEDEYPGFPTLVLGVRYHPGVREVQRRLNNWKNTTSNPSLLTIDGHFGQATFEAVKAFQQNRGLNVDGVFGTNSWRASLSFIT